MVLLLVVMLIIVMIAVRVMVIIVLVVSPVAMIEARSFVAIFALKHIRLFPVVPIVVPTGLFATGLRITISIVLSRLSPSAVVPIVLLVVVVLVVTLMGSIAAIRLLLVRWMIVVVVVLMVLRVTVSHSGIASAAASPTRVDAIAVHHVIRDTETGVHRFSPTRRLD